MKATRIISLLLALVCILSLCGCGEDDTNRVEDIITIADSVSINGETVDTVEARMGAFEGSQGDYIEFKFSEAQTFNTVFVNEKTTSIRQFNIYAEVDGQYKLIYTGKNVFNNEIAVEETTATAIKFEVVNTEIGNDAFTVIGISAYNIQENKGE